MYKIGVIGCGKIAQTRHLPEYALNPDVIIKGVYDLNGDRAKEIACQYHAKAYSSYEEMLQEPEIDAVSVCTANQTHAEIAIRALQAGKHVLCEKPMALTWQSCKKMAEEAKKQKKYLMIGHNQRFNRTHIRAKKLIQEGEIGDIITFKTNFSHAGPERWSIDSGKNIWFFDKKKSNLGVMADLGIHKTDLIQFLTDAKVIATTAFADTLDKKKATGEPIEVEDNAICIYRMSNGVVGTMTVSWSAYGKEDNSTVLYGTKGIMKIYTDEKYSLIIEKKNGEQVYYDIDQMQTNENQTESGVISAFVQSIKENKEPEISGFDALDSMKAIFASMESARTGETIEIQEDNL
ncbi:MAG: Gfo/Idh/MocA family oxidoreductase [Hespellia sp.]|nr:Gfo/Idh/MocA family oxidoreductase [Hespellia sp.]